MPIFDRMNPPAQSLWAPKAWVDGRWQHQVLLDIAPNGHWSRITPDTPAANAHAGTQHLSGALLPGMVNAHSHAFQRAFAGYAETRQTHAGSDDFWSWREQMYGVALTITPDQLRAVATQLYTDMRQGGYSHVCEFHYLHHQPSGQPYADPLEMSLALVQAAQDAGIGLTLLPVLYERAGFTQASLRANQARFASDADHVLRLRDGLRTLAARHTWPRFNVGTAIHSLRAASAPSIARLVHALGGDPAPIHLHIAEQTAEVDDCLTATGQRPVEWLCNGLGQSVQIDARWQLVHATHVTRAEIDAVARSGAGLVLCPSTEANLGDGLTDLPYWLQSQVPLAIGSDSHVTLDWPEELRWAEYGQRLQHRQRNVLADPTRYGGSTAARLFEATLKAGGAAAGLGQWGLQVGARADWVEVSVDSKLSTPSGTATAGDAPDHTLDELVFAPGRGSGFRLSHPQRSM